MSVAIKKNMRSSWNIKKRICTIAVGHTLNQIFDFLFNYPLYLGIINWLGPSSGGLVMTILSLTVCYFFVVVYDRMKIDWLGVSAVEELKEIAPRWLVKLEKWSQGSSWRIISYYIVAFLPLIPVRIIFWAIKKNDVFAFVALSIFSDPFITTVFLRHGKFGNLCKKDWEVFILSGIASNAYWTVRSFAILEIAKSFFEKFVPS